MTDSSKSPRKLPWYRGGLRFSCTQCGRCCKGPNPGHVFLNEDEIRAMADHLEMSLRAFDKTYLRRIGHRQALQEKANFDCILWSDEVGCQVYQQRPLQCRQFPFWPELLERRSDWNREAQSCPGMNSGRLYSLEDIELIRKGSEDTRSV